MVVSQTTPQAQRYISRTLMSSMATRRPRIETSFDIRKSNSSPLLKKLDHRDWLAPNEAMKIFKTLKNADQVLVALKKISSRNDYKPNESLFSLIVDRLARERRFDDIEDVLQTVKYTKIKVSDSFFSNLIKIYINVANHPEKAIQVLFRMSEFHCCPTIETFNLVLNMLVCGKHYEIVHEMYLSAAKLGVVVDTCCFNILIKGLCNCGKMDAAFSLLCEIPKQGCMPNTKTYSTLMHGLCKQNRVDEAIKLWHEMEEKDICPDTITFNILISGLCERGRIHEGMEFMDKMKLSGCYPNSATYQAILYGLLESKSFLDAKDFMNKMLSEGGSPSSLSYKLLIHGLCSSGLQADVDLVLKKMLDNGFIPQVKTWKKMIMACVENHGSSIPNPDSCCSHVL